MQDNQTYCYIRVSTDKQDYKRQVQILKENGYKDKENCKYIEETYTGTKIHRPEFDKLMNLFNKGDTLICTDLYRLSRGGVVKTLELITLLIKEKEININIIKEGFKLKGGKTPDAMTNLLLGIFSVFGQFERDLASERTIDGLKATRAKGTVLGHPRGRKSTVNNFIKTLELMVNKNMGQKTAAQKTGYPEITFKKDLKSYYEKYQTKDYKTILANLRKENL